MESSHLKCKVRYLKKLGVFSFLVEIVSSKCGTLAKLSSNSFVSGGPFDKVPVKPQVAR